jgi:hypothetical protein
MRLSKTIISIVPCLSLVFAAQAQTTTNILDWQFSTGSNPAAPSPATTVNPDGGAPQASIIDTSGNGTGANYSFPARPGAGSPMGTWEIDFGQLQLTMNRGAVGPVSYTLEVFQFVDSSGSFFPGNLSLTPAGAQLVSSSVYVPQTSGMIGSWYDNTYSWSAVTLSPSIVLDISGAGGNPILLDEVKLTIVGNLTAVPEPSCGLIAAAGLVAFGLRSWPGRKA